MSRNASITTDTKITLFINGPSERAVIRHKNCSSGERRCKSACKDGMGRDREDDNTRRPTSEPKQCGTERGNCTKQLRAASEAHPRRNPALHSVLSGQSDSCLCGSTSEGGRKGCESMTGRGGLMGGGGGAKGEPWLMKWLRFAKPWPAPCSLPNNPVTAGPSHKASIVLLACHSPHQTHNTHTPSHLHTSSQTQELPNQDAMKWNEMRGSNLSTSFLSPTSL